MLHLRRGEESFDIVFLNHGAAVDRHVTDSILAITIFVNVYVEHAIAAA